MAQNAVITMATTMLWLFNMYPTMEQTAGITITNSHSVNVAVSFKTATNTVYIFSHFLYEFSCVSFKEH